MLSTGGTTPGRCRSTGEEQTAAIHAPLPLVLALEGRNIDNELVVSAEVRAVFAACRATTSRRGNGCPEQSAAPRAPKPVRLHLDGHGCWVDQPELSAIQGEPGQVERHSSTLIDCSDQGFLQLQISRQYSCHGRYWSGNWIGSCSTG